MTDNVFHAHLDVCKQCHDNPAFLCPTGAAALRETAEQGARNAPSLDTFLAGEPCVHQSHKPEIDPVIHERILSAVHGQRHAPRILDLMEHSPGEAKIMREVADKVFGRGFSALLDL